MTKVVSFSPSLTDHELWFEVEFRCGCDISFRFNIVDSKWSSQEGYSDDPEGYSFGDTCSYTLDCKESVFEHFEAMSEFISLSMVRADINQ